MKLSDILRYASPEGAQEALDELVAGSDAADYVDYVKIVRTNAAAPEDASLTVTIQAPSSPAKIVLAVKVKDPAGRIVPVVINLLSTLLG